MAAEEEFTADRILMRHLIGLHQSHDKTNNNDARGKLANLRYAMRDRLHADYPFGRALPALAPDALTDDADRNEWRTLIAGLFGYAHDEVEDKQGVSLGAALRSLYDVRQNESLERRFMALLNSDAEHLPGHLRQSISLLKTESIGLDWGMLLRDVCAWNAPNKPIQKKWIRDYYRSRKADNADAAPTDDTDTDDLSE